MWGVCQQALLRIETAASAAQIAHYLSHPQPIWPLTLTDSPPQLEPGSRFQVQLGPWFLASQVQEQSPGRMTWIQWGAIDGWMEWRWGNGWVQLRWEGITYLPLALLTGWLLEQVGRLSPQTDP
ncbi:MAG: hypothetical protein Q6J68_06265 [Thermostichales cyanobacterium SZTDM-1c_bins_54]